MVQDSSLPSTAAVVAASGGHPGNPWREQRLLFLYRDAPDPEAVAARVADLQPLAAAA